MNTKWQGKFPPRHGGVDGWRRIPLKEDVMPLYFAYGANLDRSGMARRCPGSRPIGPAWIEAHRFFIMADGYASLRPERGAVVHGLLWDLAPGDMPLLDAYEEVATGLYRRVPRRAHAAAGPVETWIYQGCNTAVGVPRPGYMEVVIAAAEGCGLPASYRAELRDWLPREVSDAP